jgi:hypothetical protein
MRRKEYGRTRGKAGSAEDCAEAHRAQSVRAIFRTGRVLVEALRAAAGQAPGRVRSVPYNGGARDMSAQRAQWQRRTREGARMCACVRVPYSRAEGIG